MRDDDYESFVRTNRAGLLRTATSLALGDRHRAEDVVQRSLVKLYLAWPRLGDANVDAYARRVLVNDFIDERRRTFRRRERVVRDVPERAADADGGPLDPELVDALRTLPGGMRAIVVLRYVEDLSVERTAELVGCSPGTVKSQAARGLAKLRAVLQHPEPSTRPSLSDHR